MFRGADLKQSCGFYHLFMKLTKWEADPKAFFQILEVDKKIGWTHPAHVEEIVFNYKGIKIIADEEVSGMNSFILQIDQIYPFWKNNYIFRIGQNGANFEIIA